MPVRILQVVGKMHRGGMETMIMNYYRNVDRSKIQFDFLVHYEEPGDYDDEIRSLGGKIYIMPRTVPQNYFRYKNALENFFCQHNKYEVVHGHLSSAAFVYNRIAKSHGVKCCILHAHSNNVEKTLKGRISHFTSKMALKYSDCYFACSHEAADFYFGSKITSAHEIIVMKNAIDLQKYAFNSAVKNKIREVLGLHGKFVIAHVGSFTLVKNHSFLLEIFTEVYKSNRDTVLLLVGDGSLMPEIMNKVHVLGMDDVVKFLGVRSDVNEILQGADVFLLPSLFEGLGIVLVEAQAAGLKCFTSADVVSEEADITELIERISIKETAGYWAEQVLKYKNGYTHENTLSKIDAAGYDIKKQANWLEEFYLAKCRSSI